jgi:hypothetical protein
MSLVVQQQVVVGKHLVVQLVHNLLHLIHKHWYYILDHKFHWQLFVGNESLGILGHKMEVEEVVVGVHHNLPHQSHMDHYYILDYIFRFRNAEGSNQLGNVLYKKFLLEEEEEVELLAVDLGFHLGVVYLYQE